MLPAADERLTYVCTDAAEYLRHCDQSYDLLLVDIFSGAHTPAWLLEKAVIEQLHDLLTEHGALAFNLLVSSDHDFRRFYRECQVRFGDHCLSLPVAGLENRIVYGVNGAPPARDMGANMQAAMQLGEELDIDFLPILSVIYHSNPAGAGAYLAAYWFLPPPRHFGESATTPPRACHSSGVMVCSASA